VVHGVEEITEGQRRLASVPAPVPGVAASSSSSRFAELVVAVERPLRASLVARYGPDRGREATAEALAFAWENLDRVAAMANPAGYLYRVGQSRTRQRRVRFVPYTPAIGMPEIEPVLQRAIAKLSEHQRIAVVLTHGYPARWGGGGPSASPVIAADIGMVSPDDIYGPSREVV
jgi:hypothetical protein